MEQPPTAPHADPTGVVVVHGDITEQRVDAVVNAANSSLLGGSGVDGAIHAAGGPAILEECRQIRATRGECPTGEAVVTTAGDLPARLVIHTVGPVWRGGGDGEPELLRRCYRRSLEEAVASGVGSIAFPAISTGVYGYPSAAATEIAVDEVLAFRAEHPDTAPDVVFVCFSAEDATGYRRVLAGAGVSSTGPVALRAAVVVLCLLTVAGLLALYPWGGPPAAEQQGFAQTEEERFAGRITALTEVPGQDEFLLPGARSLIVEVTLDDGRVIAVDAVDEVGIFQPGQDVEVSQVGVAGGPEIWAIVDFPRGVPLAVLAIAFGAAVVALGRWQGVRALVGLGASAVLIVGFLVPALLAGRDATLLALVTSLAVMLVTLPLSHGWSRVTLAAASGTGAALLLTVGLAALAVELTALTGLASEDVQFVRFTTGQAVDVRGLLVAGMIIGTLGVLDDVTVSQASTVEALRRAAPTRPDRWVFGEALRVGRDHIAATVNTLVLAYAGAALPLLMLFSVGDAPLGETLTSELVAQEIVRTLVGSIGLVAAVPLTTGLAVLVSARPDPAVEPPTPPEEGAAVAGHAPEVELPGASEWEGDLRARYGLPRREGGPSA